MDSVSLGLSDLLPHLRPPLSTLRPQTSLFLSTPVLPSQTHQPGTLWAQRLTQQETGLSAAEGSRGGSVLGLNRLLQRPRGLVGAGVRGLATVHGHRRSCGKRQGPVRSGRTSSSW